MILLNRQQTFEQQAKNKQIRVVCGIHFLSLSEDLNQIQFSLKAGNLPFFSRFLQNYVLFKSYSNKFLSNSENRMVKMEAYKQSIGFPVATVYSSFISSQLTMDRWQSTIEGYQRSQTLDSISSVLHTAESILKEDLAPFEFGKLLFVLLLEKFPTQNI